MQRADPRNERQYYWRHSDPDTTPEEHTPSHGPCPSSCNYRWRQAMEAYETAIQKWIGRGSRGDEPQPPETEPWQGEPVLCRKCGSIARGALRELPDAYKALDTVKYLSRTASADEERRGRSDVPPSPSPGADHQDEICRTVTEWEDDLRHHLGHRAAADTGNQAADLTASVEYLNRNWQAMIERPECAGDFADDVTRLFRISIAMVKNKPIRKTLPVACPTCDMETLVQEEGPAGRPWYVECVERLGGCSRLFTENEYEFFVLLIKDGHVTSGASS
jgi:hypothetical protein